MSSAVNAQCVMGYIIYLTIIMNKLFLRTRDVSEEHITSVLGAYAKSGEQARIHNVILRFTESMEGRRLVDKDYVLEEIIRLINEYRVDPPQHPTIHPERSAGQHPPQITNGDDVST